MNRLRYRIMKIIRSFIGFFKILLSEPTVPLKTELDKLPPVKKRKQNLKKKIIVKKQIKRKPIKNMRIK